MLQEREKKGEIKSLGWSLACAVGNKKKQCWEVRETGMNPSPASLGEDAARGEGMGLVAEVLSAPGDTDALQTISCAGLFSAPLL